MIIPNYIPIDFHDSEMARIKEEIKEFSAILNSTFDKDSDKASEHDLLLIKIRSQEKEIFNLKTMIKSLMDELGSGKHE